MIGSTVNKRNSFLPRKFERVTISASISPIKVVPVAHKSASQSVFQATPHPLPPHKHAGTKFQSLGCAKRSHNIARDKLRS